MKNTFLSLILALTLVAANAQEVSHATWPSTAVLPETHNWSIGFNVIPIISSVGNLFHTPSGNDTVFSQMQYTLVGLYVKDPQTAYRLKVRIGFGSQAQYNLVQDDASPTQQIADELKQTSMNITLGAGIQKWLGKGRLRGIYGAELAFMLQTGDVTYNYGNPMTSSGATSTLPTNWATAPVGGTYTSTPGATSRETEYKPGTTFGLGLDGFIGVEYFFAPKMSLSAEYNWGFMYNSTGEGAITTETWDGSAAIPAPSSNTVNTGNSSSFILDVQDATSIIFHLYF